jgi:hypothetical protein
MYFIMCKKKSFVACVFAQKVGRRFFNLQSVCNCNALIRHGRDGDKTVDDQTSSWSPSRLEIRFAVVAGSASPRPSGASRGSRRRCCCPPCDCRACHCHRVGRMAASRVRGIQSQSHLVASMARDAQSRHLAMVVAEAWSGCLSRQS